MNNKLEPVLNKTDIMNILVEYLLQNPKNQIRNLQMIVENQLEQKGLVGNISEYKGGFTHHFTRRLSDEDALLINECIYDLLYGRALTPGVNESNRDLPFLHVSDMEKLKAYKSN